MLDLYLVGLALVAESKARSPATQSHQRAVSSEEQIDCSGTTSFSCSSTTLVTT